MAFTSQGYTPRTASEIKAEQVNKLKETQSAFLEFNADIQNCLLDTSCVPLVELENIFKEFANGIALDNQNEFLFYQLLASLGLMPKAEFSASVDIQFNGEEGDFIPKDTEVGDTQGKFTFKTQSDGVIGTSGIITLTCLGESQTIAEANTLTQINSIVDSGITCNNPTASVAYVPAETFAQIKARAQAKLRANKSGGVDYCINALSGVLGVNQRLVNCRETEIQKEISGQNYLKKGFEFVVGGGDSYEIANILRKGFLQTQYLISNPSSNENTRTITHNINVLGAMVEVNFTRPKKYSFNLECQVLSTAKQYGVNEIKTMIETPLQDYLNNLRVGVVPNKTKMQAIVLAEFATRGIELTNIVSIDFRYSTASGEWTKFNNELPNIYHDIYLECLQVSVTDQVYIDNTESSEV